MYFECTEHGELDEVEADGYSIGHRTSRMNELDLEGVTFVIKSPGRGEELRPEHVSSDADGYLKKFSEPYQQVVDAFSEYDAISLGLQCPECDGRRETVRIQDA